MDLITLFLEVIKEHGLWSVIATLGLLSITHYSNKVNKIFSYVHKRDTTPESFNSRVKATVFIQDLLHETMEKVGASRVIVILYHNGQHSIGGHGFNKMSCVHETIDPEVNFYGRSLKPILPRFNSIPISAFSLITKKLFTEGKFIIHSLPECKKQDLSTFEELKYHGASSAKFYPLKDVTNHIFGFISFEFRSNRPHKGREKQIQEEENCVDKVSSVLEYMAKENTNGITPKETSCFTSTRSI